MRNQSNPYNLKIYIKDQQGTEVAYCYNGMVYAVAGGHQVGSLRGGNIYSIDGQLLGRLAPRGVVVCDDGSIPEAFLRIVGKLMKTS
jgi:hypothetical protein